MKYTSDWARKNKSSTLTKSQQAKQQSLASIVPSEK